MSTQGNVLTEIHDGVARVTFSHPQSNSLPGDLLQRLAGEIAGAGERDDVRLILLQSEGEKAFCAGASFDELVSIDDREKGRRFFSGFASVINAMRKAPCFVVARVQGRAVGGGVGLAAAADYCIAHASASVKLSELAVGIGPFVVGPAVARKIGQAAFSEMAIHATGWKPAAWALEKGLYAEVCETAEALDAVVAERTAQLAASNPDAMRALKAVFWEGTEHWDGLLAERAETSGRLVLSDFTKKAIAAFKKR